MCVSVSVCPHKHLDTTRADTPVRAILFVCTMQDLCEHIVYMHRRTTQQRGEKFGRDNVDEVPRNDGDSVEDAKEFLINLASEHLWNITSVDEKGIQV